MTRRSRCPASTAPGPKLPAPAPPAPPEVPPAQRPCLLPNTPPAPPGVPDTTPVFTPRTEPPAWCAACPSARWAGCSAQSPGRGCFQAPDRWRSATSDKACRRVISESSRAEFSRLGGGTVLPRYASNGFSEGCCNWSKGMLVLLRLQGCRLRQLRRLPELVVKRMRCRRAGRSTASARFTCRRRMAAKTWMRRDRYSIYEYIQFENGSLGANLRCSVHARASSRVSQPSRSSTMRLL